MSARTLAWVLGVLAGAGLVWYGVTKAGAPASGCPETKNLDELTAKIRSGSVSKADAEKIATSYANAGCPEAEAAVRASILVASVEQQKKSGTDSSLAMKTNDIGIKDTVAYPWSKYSDQFTNDPNVVALEKIWRDRVVAILEKDPRTLSSAELTDAKTLYNTLVSMDAGWVTEVLRRYIALADPSYGKAGDPQIFPAAPVTQLFPVVAGMRMRDWSGRKAMFL